MTPSRTFKGLALTATFSLLLAAPALGVPAGDEYLPAVPSPTGDKPVNETGGSSADPTTGAGGSVEDDGSKKGDDQKKDGSESADEDAGGTLVSGSGGDDGDDSGGVLDTLLDPIVLLLIAGVLTIAIGMLLARRQNGDSPDPSRARRKSSDAPPTPDGEIVGSPERP
jgi:hypothetical protein